MGNEIFLLRIITLQKELHVISCVMHHWTLYMGLSMELLFGDICNWMQLLNNEDANLLPGQGRRSFHSYSVLKCDDPESEWNKEIHSERTKVMMCSTDWSPFVWLLGRWISHAYRQGSWLDNVPTPPLFIFLKTLLCINLLLWF